MKLTEDILIVEFKNGIEITKAIAEEMVNERLSFQKGKNYPVIIVANGFTAVTRDVREYLKTAGLKGMKSGCFVVENFFEKVIVNFFLLVRPPQIPSKMFTNLEEAMEWSRKFK